MYMTKIIARVKQYISTFQMLDNDYGSRCCLNTLVSKIPKDEFARDLLCEEFRNRPFGVKTSARP